MVEFSAWQPGERSELILGTVRTVDVSGWRCEAKDGDEKKRRRTGDRVVWTCTVAAKLTNLFVHARGTHDLSVRANYFNTKQSIIV